MTLKPSENNLTKLLEILRKFETISGLKINTSKTEIMPIGKKNINTKTIVEKYNLKWTQDPIKILGIEIHPEKYRRQDHNFRKKVEKIKGLLRVWQQRDLTLYGKCIVIKSLASSQLVYLFTTLDRPEEQLFAEIEKILFKFVWNNKSEKLKRNILKLPIDKGGINMVDIRLQDKALKLSWINRLLDEDNLGTWKNLLWRQLKPIGNIFWQCNIKFVDLCKQVNIINNLWGDILETWCEYNFHIPITKKSILSQVIWFNSNIKVGNYVIYFKDLHESGLTHLTDLIKEDGSFYSYVELIQTYDVNLNYLHYYSIMSAIPKQWKQIIANEANCTPCNELPIFKLLKLSKIPKQIYKEYISKLVTDENMYNSYMKWSRDLTDISMEEWEYVFERVYTTTINTKLRAFQYRLIHKIIPTNEWLYKVGLPENEECTFCKIHTESIKHIMWDCQTTKKIIRNIVDWIFEITGVRINYTCQEFLFGTETTYLEWVNLIFLLAKQYIYYCRCTQNLLNMENFKKRVVETKDIEKKIAVKRGKIAYHNQKWKSFV